MIANRSKIIMNSVLEEYYLIVVLILTATFDKNYTRNWTNLGSEVEKF